MISIELLLRMFSEAETPTMGLLAVYDMGYENGSVAGYDRGSTDVGLAWTTDGQVQS